jgi:hypothetical protein
MIAYCEFFYQQGFFQNDETQVKTDDYDFSFLNINNIKKMMHLFTLFGFCLLTCNIEDLPCKTNARLAVCNRSCLYLVVAVYE